MNEKTKQAVVPAPVRQSAQSVPAGQIVKLDRSGTPATVADALTSIAAGALGQMDDLTIELDTAHEADGRVSSRLRLRGYRLRRGGNGKD